MSTLHDLAFSLFRAGVQAADPSAALREALAENPVLSPRGRLFAIAIGKAAPAMMRQAAALLNFDRALVVTHHENDTDVPEAEVLRAGHPVPDEAGLKAGRKVLELLHTADRDDLVLALISGGGSALLPAPAQGLTLADKQSVNSALLGAGLDIVAMNLVRQQLSELKGGGFLRHAAPAEVRGFVLSDVIGDDLRAIASGPTVAPLGTRAEAMSICRQAGIWDDLPEAVQRHLSASETTPRLPSCTNTLIGSNGHSIDAMRGAVPDGWRPVQSPMPLVGDVSDAARAIVSAALASQPGDILLMGGETTVQLRGDGLGGRNQELALRVALDPAMANLPGEWVFLSGGTDGRDGPTEAAGAIVDQATASRIRAAGGDASALLANNDSNRALDLAGDLMITGATGTNVADLQVLIRS